MMSTEKADEPRRRAYVHVMDDETRSRFEEAITCSLTLETWSVVNFLSYMVRDGSVLQNVMLSNVPQCTCSDFKSGNHCVHIMFVLMRVLGVSRTNPVVWQRALLSSEISEILDKAPAHLKGAVDS